MYKFDLEDYAGTYRNVCKNANELKAIGASIIKNDNGEVEVYLKNGTPYTNINNKQCCELLGYNFDIDTQKCNWKANSGLACDDDCTKKLIFNPNKNKGSLFKINEGDTCTLDISFDYLLNFDCTFFKSNCLNNQSQINSIESELNETKRQYNTLLNEAKFNTDRLIQTQREFDGLQYVIKGVITTTNTNTTTTTNTNTTTTTATNTTTNTTTTNTTNTNAIDTFAGQYIDYTYNTNGVYIKDTSGIIPIVSTTNTTTTTTNIDPNITTVTPTNTVDYTDTVLIQYDSQFQPKIYTNETVSAPVNDLSKPYDVIMPLGLDYNTLNFTYDNNPTAEITNINNNEPLPPTLFGFYLYGKKSAYAVTSIQTNSLLPKTLLLSNDGLLVWSKIIGEEKYKIFLSNYGCDEKQYTSENFNNFIYETIRTSSANNKQISDYYVETTQGVCDKKLKYDELNGYKLKDTEYKKKLTELNTKINDLTNSLNTIKSTNTYNDVLKNLENIKVTFVLEHDNNDNNYSSVYQETLFNIGEGNMMNFINEKSPNTGIIISGSSSDGILTPPYSYGQKASGYYGGDNRFDCGAYRDEFIKTLYLERYKGNYPEPANSQEQIDLNKKLNSWYNSTWVKYNISVPNDIIQQIKNTKIRFSILVESCCIDLCLLIDKIEFNKTCQSVDNEEITITKPLGFEFEKVMDNKKSWVSNNDEPTREFDLTFRETQYDVNDYKLILNTKEIELKIDGSNAIEEDILCSLQSSNCLLTGSTFDSILENPEDTVYSMNINNEINYLLIIEETLPSDYESYYINSLIFKWLVTVENNCGEIHEFTIHEGSVTSILDMIPDNGLYMTVLSDLATTYLDVSYAHNGAVTIFTDTKINNALVNGLFIDLKLDLTIDYEVPSLESTYYFGDV